MKVENLMSKNAAACTAGHTLNDAARIMWEHDCGFVPVIESEASPRVVGVLTDRDICMAAYTRGAELAALRVADAMAHTVYTCKADDPLSAAEARMAEAKVRRLPVVDDEGQLLGVLSFADIAREAGRQSGRGKSDVRPSEVGALIAAISAPRQLTA